MGLTASPLDSSSVIKAAEILSSDPELRQKMAAKGREYALHTFDIKLIADKFESIIREIVSN
jgi:glycosyltransferase involved in cell wall biosynthesis